MSTNSTAKLLNADSPFFSVSSLQGMLNLTRESARTTASRLVQRGILVRIQRDVYTLANAKYSLFSLANALHQPSVISLETALNYWGIIVQVPQTVFRLHSQAIAAGLITLSSSTGACLQISFVSAR